MRIGRPVSAAIAVHAALDTDVHGVGGSTILSATDIATLISTHADLFTGIHGATIAHKASDKTMNNDDTLANDADLVLAVGANDVWLILLVLITISATVTPDIDYLFAVPGGGAIRGTVTWSRTAPEALYDMTSESLMQVNTSEKVLMHQLIYKGGGTAGNLQLQWAQHIATVEDTKMKAQSLMLCHRLA